MSRVESPAAIKNYYYKRHQNFNVLKSSSVTLVAYIIYMLRGSIKYFNQSFDVENS